MKGAAFTEMIGAITKSVIDIVGKNFFTGTVKKKNVFHYDGESVKRVKGVVALDDNDVLIAVLAEFSENMQTRNWLGLRMWNVKIK